MFCRLTQSSAKSAKPCSSSATSHQHVYFESRRSFPLVGRLTGREVWKPVICVFGIQKPSTIHCPLEIAYHRQSSSTRVVTTFKVYRSQNWLFGIIRIPHRASWSVSSLPSWLCRLLCWRCRSPSTDTTASGTTMYARTRLPGRTTHVVHVRC